MLVVRIVFRVVPGHGVLFASVPQLLYKQTVSGGKVLRLVVVRISVPAPVVMRIAAGSVYLAVRGHLLKVLYLLLGDLRVPAYPQPLQLGKSVERSHVLQILIVTYVEVL